jgi:hypothetical protein
MKRQTLERIGTILMILFFFFVLFLIPIPNQSVGGP